MLERSQDLYKYLDTGTNMSTPQITIHDSQTGETIVRDMTADEIAAYTIDYTQPTANETPIAD